MFTFTGSIGKFKKSLSNSFIADVLDGLIGHYTFEDGSGTTITDSSPAGLNGTAANGVTFPTGKVGSYAGGFSGSNQAVDFASNQSWALQEFTIMCWSKSGNQSTTACLFSTAFIGAYKNWNFNKYFSEDRIDFEWGDGGGSYKNLASPHSSIPDDEWAHLVLTFDATGDAIIYINGANVAQTATNGITYETTLYRQSLGARRFNGGSSGTIEREYNGDLDDARIYNRVLSPTEVQQIYDKYK